MNTLNIAAYAKVCNVEVSAMIHHLQRDCFAREQFEEWKKMNLR